MLLPYSRTSLYCERFFFFQILMICIQSIGALPIILLAVSWLSSWEMNVEGVVIALIVTYFVIFFGIAMLQTGSNTPNFLNNLAR